MLTVGLGIIGFGLSAGRIDEKRMDKMWYSVFPNADPRRKQEQ